MTKQIVIAGTGLPELIPLIEEFCNHNDEYQLIGFIDDNPKNAERNLFGYDFLGPFEYLNTAHNTFTINSISRTPQIRVASTLRLKELGAKFFNLIHPSVDFFATSIGEGNIIDRKSVIQKGASIGDHNILLTNVTIGHDTNVGSFNFLGHNCVCNGSVSIKDYCFLGANSSVAPNITIGSNVKVSLNTPVFTDVPDTKTVTLRTPITI